MLVESCFQLGIITKTHGIEGNVIIFLDTDFPQRYENLESVFVEIKQKLVPFFIDSILVKGNKAIVKFEGINSIEEAGALKGNFIYLPLDFLPDLGKDQFYYHEVIDYMVFDENKGKLGKITNIYEANGNDMFAIDFKNKEILVPIQNELILKIDKIKREIHVALPDGLIEIYLDQK